MHYFSFSSISLVSPSQKHIHKRSKSTHQPFHFSIYQLFNLSTFQPFNFSTYQLFNLSTFQPFNFSNYQLFKLSTFQTINFSTFQLFNLFFFLLLSSCANIVPPTGGLKDETPPKLIHSIPTDGQRNYKSKKLELEFDEFVNANNLSTTWLVSPPLKYPVNTKAKKHKVLITLQDTLLPNTTYRFQFENSIVDITEKNPPEELTLTFSTGEYIDTGIVKGTITYVLNGFPVQGITTGLIPVNDSDTVHYSQKRPFFLTRSNKTGEFQLKNLPPGMFHIIAFDDKNKNYIGDISSERVAFLDTAVSLGKDTIYLNLSLYLEDHLSPYITKSLSDDRNRVTIQFSEGVDSLSLFQLDSNSSYPVPFIPLPDGKNIVAFPKVESDSISISISGKDSSTNAFSDTLIVSVNPEAKKDSMPFAVTTSPISGTLLMNSDQLKFLFQIPVIEKTIPSLEFVADSVRSTVLNSPDDYSWNNSGNELKVNKIISFTKNMRMTIPDSMFTNIYGLKNRKEQFIFHKENEAGTGAISGTLETSWEKFILALLDDRGKIAGQLKNKTSFQFELLKPGKYTLRVHEDKNGNGRWDRGDIRKNILPEKLFFYKNIMPLKANWEIENIVVKVE